MRRTRRHQRAFLYAPNTVGLTIAVLMLLIALSPSLLPRLWWSTGGTVGLSMVFGYVIGELGEAVWSAVTRLIGLEITLRHAWVVRLRWAWYVLLTAMIAISWTANIKRQQELQALTSLQTSGWYGQAVGIAMGITILALVVFMVRLVRWAYHRTNARIGRFLPKGLTAILSAVLIALIIALIGSGLVIRPAIEYISKAATLANSIPLDGRTAPNEPQRSGSPASLQSWASLGAKGQVFVADGPHAHEIQAITGQPAMEPIRVYAGDVQGRNVTATADQVIKELDRTNAWERKALIVYTSVGPGYVNDWSISSAEFLLNGNCASASMQYSYLVSGFAYVLDRDSPVRAGQALFDAVYARWRLLDAAHRPRLIVAGESLGSYGSQGAFQNLNDLMTKTDGAIFVGTPRFTPLWSAITSQRQIGSPEVAPVVDSATHVRFVTSPADLSRDYFGEPYDPWGDKRYVFVQHPSDPVVWWSPELLWKEPDWAREAVGRDVLHSFRWMPWVSFWQIAFDMPNALSAPGGHGHQYNTELVPVWDAVLLTHASQTRMDAIAAAIPQTQRPH